jgi:hypothetical protein
LTDYGSYAIMYVLMTTFESVYAPLAINPPFVNKIGSLATEKGFGDAVLEVFADANIALELTDETPKADGHGLIIAGDHSQGMEPILVQAAVALADRDNSRVIASPLSFSGRLIQGTGAGKDLIIPVIPTAWAAENRFPTRELGNNFRRVMHPNVMSRPKDELKQLNRDAISVAAQSAVAGEVVTIFPTGGLTSTEGHWHRGLGQIISALPEEAMASTQIAAFRPGTFSYKNILKSLVLRDMGIRPPRQAVAMSLRLMGPAGEVCADQLAAVGSDRAQEISNAVKARYAGLYQD